MICTTTTNKIQEINGWKQRWVGQEKARRNNKHRLCLCCQVSPFTKLLTYASSRESMTTRVHTHSHPFQNPALHSFPIFHPHFHFWSKFAMYSLSPPHTTTTSISHSTTHALINKTKLLELHNHNHNHSRISITISSKSNSNKILAIGNRVGVETEIAVVEIHKPQFEVSRGFPSPFGATAQEDGVNFAIYSLNAHSATLCLFTLSDFKNVCHNSIQFQHFQNSPSF